MKTDRATEIKNLLAAIGRGWVVGYSSTEIAALKKEYFDLTKA